MSPGFKYCYVLTENACCVIQTNTIKVVLSFLTNIQTAAGGVLQKRESCQSFYVIFYSFFSLHFYEKVYRLFNKSIVVDSYFGMYEKWLIF